MFKCFKQIPMGCAFPDHSCSFVHCYKNAILKKSADFHETVFSLIHFSFYVSFFHVVFFDNGTQKNIAWKQFMNLQNKIFGDSFFIFLTLKQYYIYLIAPKRHLTIYFLKPGDYLTAGSITGNHCKLIALLLIGTMTFAMVRRTVWLTVFEQIRSFWQKMIFGNFSKIF